MPKLILVRHGQSEWNLENRFTGWTDVDLSPRGEAEARRAGELLRQAELGFDLAYTSVLTRAIRTLWLVMEETKLVWAPQVAAWRLNERHYGALQGLNKAETAERHGKEQVAVWRRSYSTPPPPLEPMDPRHPRFDPRYAGVDPASLPAAESLKDTLERVLPYWQGDIAPMLARGRRIIIAAHGNSLRALIKHLEHVPDEVITHVEVPTGNPLVYDLHQDLSVAGRRYLDAERAAPLPG
ncbi:MAG: 2,3-diphosphoglycerate-dependent phosphoglycerate mutase [Deltaproteobacteria bacterium]|nr:2,3-diphosphoglycerate-dependent phosphoglycerate mutase [Deltaproteobacteria bacterium]